MSLRRHALTHVRTAAVRLLRALGLVLLAAQALGATTFTVSNTNDAGAGSLRQAIIDANADATATAISPHTIDATGVSGSISLASELPNLNNHMAIMGSGARVLTVLRSAGPGTPDFRVFVVPGGRTVSMSGLTISNGRISAFGAGILNSGTLKISECTVSGNTAIGFVSGGGIFSDGTLVANGVTFSGNSCDFGAGLALYPPGTSTITNCTISGNNSPSATGGLGGGILIGFSPVAVSIVNSTIASNTIANSAGGGIGLASGDATQTLSYRNTIIGGNTSPQVAIYSGAVTSLGYNISSDFTGALTATGDKVNTNPLLGLLADNGGPTNTHAPLAKSPAIDAGGSVAGLATDQRGTNYPRVQDLNAFANATGGNGSDIGAVEVRRFIVNITGDGGDATAIGDGLADTDLGTGGDQTSLRAAIQESNADADFNVIEFAIGAAGSLQTIPVTSGLPVISSTVYVDGWSQGGSGYTGTPRIEIDGIATLNTFGLNLQATNCTVRGLAINRFPQNAGNGIGIGIFGAAAMNAWIYGNHIGVDPSGATNRGNGQLGIWVGIGAEANLIGTNGDGINDAAERNVISGNASDGVRIQSDDNVVAGNLIGTDASGTAAIPNGRGIQISAANDNVIGGNLAGTRNLISGNTGGGILLNNSASGTVIAGNYIGTDVTGALDLGNNYSGIYLGTSVTNTRIGTNGDGVRDVAERNVISGNANDGVTFGFTNSAPPTNTVVAGNYIGTDATGTSAIPNDDSGVYLTGTGHRVGTNADGTNDAAERNLLSGNGQSGVSLTVTVSTTANNTIAGNYIGTTADGAAALGNGIAGVRVLNGSASTTIGGTAAAAMNVIAHNGTGSSPAEGGVLVVGAGTGNRIIGNSVHSNDGPGIDIDGNGVTANDVDDPDGGPNLRQNFPEISDAKYLAGGDIALAYAVPSSIANSAYPIRLEIFRSDGAGEGRTLLATASYAAPGSTTLTFTPPTPIAVGDEIVATATDANGNTSEFSAEITVTPTITLQPQPLSVCAPDQAQFTVEATGTGLTYQWRHDGTPLVDGGNVSGATTATLTISPTSASDIGSYDVIVSGTQSDAAALFVDVAPTIDAPDDVTIACTESTDPSNTGAATASDDVGTPVVDYTDDVTAGDCAGNYTIVRTWTATDACGHVTSADQTITVQDIVGPTITLSTTPIELWPADHTYATISVAQMVDNVSDNCSDLGVGDVVITHVTSDEAENANGNGDGNTIDDMVIASDCGSVQLRQERDGTGDGRVYTVHFALTDECGNVSTASFDVTVRQNQGGSLAVDGGAVYCESGSCGSCPTLKPVTGASLAAVGAELGAIAPNPFTSGTSIPFRIGARAHVVLKVFALDGSELATLVDEQRDGGSHAVRWDGRDADGRQLASGTYLCRLDVDGVALTATMVLAR